MVSEHDDWACPLCEVGFADQDLNTAGLECPYCSMKVVDAGKYLEHKKNELCASSSSHKV
jgi:DNA-directed RNA polymerase subunit RPC12/RpoP